MEPYGTRDASRVEPEPEIPGKSPNCKTRVIQARTRVPDFLSKNCVFKVIWSLVLLKIILSSILCTKTLASIFSFKTHGFNT